MGRAHVQRRIGRARRRAVPVGEARSRPAFLGGRFSVPGQPNGGTAVQPAAAHTCDALCQRGGLPTLPRPPQRATRFLAAAACDSGGRPFHGLDTTEDRDRAAARPVCVTAERGSHASSAVCAISEISARGARGDTGGAFRRGGTHDSRRRDSCAAGIQGIPCDDLRTRRDHNARRDRTGAITMPGR